jgi:hypothetical protein
VFSFLGTESDHKAEAKTKGERTNENADSETTLNVKMIAV